MGIFSFFEQIGHLIECIIDAAIFTVQGIIHFFSTIITGYSYIPQIVEYLPIEVGVGFSVLFSTSIIYLIVKR